MKPLYYRSLTAALLALFIGGCAPSEKEMDPAPTAQKGVSDLTYSKYNNLPEPLVDVTALYLGLNTGGTAAGNDLFGLGRSQISGGHKIYSHRQGRVSNTSGIVAWAPYDFGPWTQISGPNGGGAVKLAVKGFTLYAVTSSNELWTTDNPYGGSGWVRLPFQAVDIATNNFYVYFLGAASLYGGHPIYRLDGTTAVEVSPGAAGITLAVDGFDRPWVTTSAEEIWVGPYPWGPAGGFTRVPGVAVDIASNGSTVAVLGSASGFGTTGYSIWKRNTNVPSNEWAWTAEGGEAVQIGSNGQGDYFVVSSLGELFKGL